MNFLKTKKSRFRVIFQGVLSPFLLFLAMGGVLAYFLGPFCPFFNYPKYKLLLLNSGSHVASIPRSWKICASLSDRIAVQCAWQRQRHGSLLTAIFAVGLMEAEMLSAERISSKLRVLFSL